VAGNGRNRRNGGDAGNGGRGVMVAEWVLTLAAAGGSALVGAAANEAWHGARSGVVALFGRAGRRRQELAAGWADDTAAEVERAPEQDRDRVRERLVPVWATRLADLIEEHPEISEDLRAWAEQVRSGLPGPQQTWVHTYIARDHAHQYNAPHGSITMTHQGGNPAP
jgi:hypothetical protein